MAAQRRFSAEEKADIAEKYQAEDEQGNWIYSAVDLAKVYGVSSHTIHSILDKAGIPRRSRSDAAILVASRPEVKERHRLAGHAIWEDSEKRQRMIKGMNRSEVKERHRVAQIAAHSRPETAQRHSDVALAMWTERKEKLAAAERILAAALPTKKKPGNKGGRPVKTSIYTEAYELRSKGRTWPQIATILLPKEKDRHAAAEQLRIGVLRFRKKTPVQNL